MKTACEGWFDSYRYNIYFICKARQKRRMQRQKKTLFNNNLPNTEENQLIYDIFMKTVDPTNIKFAAQTLPSTAIWMKDTELLSSVLLQPDSRNPIEVVFGGFYLRKALELSFATASRYRYKLRFGYATNDYDIEYY